MSAHAADEPATPHDRSGAGLSLAPFRGLRPAVEPDRLGRMLCPPYDVIDAAAKRDLLAADPDNVVAVILPEPTDAGYADAAARLDGLVGIGEFQTDDAAAVYVYEMREPDGHVTRGLLGAVELRDPADGVILPHENTMAGPVADRLAVMTATGTDLEPIYLVYDGGGAASALVGGVGSAAPIAEATTRDGVTHRLWAVTDPAAHAAVADDLGGRSALIADGHHRYATYRERQRLAAEKGGRGPWDRGLALLVDTSEYGPQVHAIHRVVAGLTIEEAVRRLSGTADARPVVDVDQALVELDRVDGFAAVLTDGGQAFVVSDESGALAKSAGRPGEAAALADLDVTVVHRGLVEHVWGLADDVETIGYAHSISEAVTRAGETGGFAVVLRPTPVAAVAAVAAAGARMPRKSTLFTPKPASGLVMRRLADQRE